MCERAVVQHSCRLSLLLGLSAGLLVSSMTAHPWTATGLWIVGTLAMSPEVWTIELYIWTTSTPDMSVLSSDRERVDTLAQQSYKICVLMLAG